MVERRPTIIQNETGSQSFHAVVMPYSQNLKEHGPNAGENRLSFYSAFALNAGLDLYKDGLVSKLVLCGETTFGEDRSTTSDLMKDALLRLGVPEDDIFVIEKPNLDNTAAQVKAISEFRKENDMEHEPLLIVGWDFHNQRLGNHMRGFGLRGHEAASGLVVAERVHKHHRPSFNLDKMYEVLPVDEFEAREKTVRKISKFDRRGLIPRLILALGRGGSVTDIKRVQDENGQTHLVLENTTGKKKLEQLQSTQLK